MSLINDSDRHQVYLAKLATHLLRTKLYPSLAEAMKAARAILLDAENIDSVRVMRRIQDTVAKEVAPILDEGYAALNAGLMEMAVYEAGYSAKLFGSYAEAALAVPAETQIARFVNQAVMTLGSGERASAGTWAQYVTGARDSAVEQYNGLIARGYQSGQTVNQMAREIRNSTEGLLQREAEALARTGQSHYANSAREAMAAANSDIIKVRVYTATFDNRTTLGCRSLHGKSWPVDSEDYIVLPRHWNCRSVYVYAKSVEDAMRGNRSSVGGIAAATETVDKKRLSQASHDDDGNPILRSRVMYRGRRDADIFNPGPIRASTTQDAWLRDQPAWFQDSARGETRAKLFRDGGMKIEQFTDMLGNDISLAELRRLDADAFRRAGL